VRYDRSESQFFPYVVRDVYGTKVLPEALGYKFVDPASLYSRLAPTHK
jgi:hypothetical protein